MRHKKQKEDENSDIETKTEWILYKYISEWGSLLPLPKEQDRFYNEELALFARNHIRAIEKKGAYVEKVTTTTELIQ